MTHLKKHSKAFVAFVCILTMLVQLSFALPAAAANSELDVIFVLDDSASMKDTDPEKLSVTAISKFVDSVATNIDAKYGIAIYGEEASDTLPLGATVQEVKDFVNEYAKQDETYTNAAAGIKWATDELEKNGRPNSQKVIILIGDGENDFDDYRTPAEAKAAEENSEKQKEEAVKVAKDKGFVVHAIAVNVTKEPGFKKYFEEIAKETNGACYEPNNFDELQEFVDQILSTVTGAVVGDEITVTLDPNEPQTITQTVEEGIIQLIIQCDYEDPLDVKVTSPSKIQYDKNSPEYSDDAVNKYLQFKISNPEPGDWTITYTSLTGQIVKSKGITYGNVKVTLKATNSDDVIEGKTARYVADVEADGKLITDEATLLGFEPKLCIVKLDKDGNRGNVSSADVSVVSGQLSAEPKFKSVGEYVIYIEIQGDSSAITSNELTVTVNPDPNKLPLWAIILIILGILLLIVAAILGLNAMRNAPDYINSDLSVKITAKAPTMESMIFQNNTFNCSSILNKQNTLSDVIRAYVSWYRSIGNGEMTEITINQFLNSNLSEVTDKIKLAGTKSGKTVVTIPKGLDIELDGAPVKSERKIAFNSIEKDMELVIKNNGYNYIIELMFRR